MCLFVGSLCPFVSQAQTVRNETDSIRRLQEVVVSERQPVGTAANRQFSVGSLPLRYERKALLSVQNQSLSDYLQANSPIYFKEYGKGMLSTISLRGTTASQTAVQWNGMDINMPTMGQTDFSLLPLFFFDAIEVHRSGESALYGNGAIGGSVQLRTVPLYKKRPAIEFRNCIGSYGYLFSGLGVRVGGERWESRTQALFATAKNNFPFTNATTYDQRTERVNNAEYRQYGVLQEIYFRPVTTQELSLRAWYTDSERNLQPFMSENEMPHEYDSIRDRTLRMMATYNATFSQLKTSLNAGYSHDYEHFRTNTPIDTIATIAMSKIFARGETEYVFSKLSLKAGIQTEYIRPDVYAYRAGTHEWRTDIFLLARWQPAVRWSVSGGIRQNFVTNVTTPFTPSLGVAYQALQTGVHEITIRASASGNTKIPTLNDRYWGKTSAHLRPEAGRTAETGIDYTFTQPAWTLKGVVTGYYNRIKDWIRWLPVGGLWRPQNVNLVDAYGAEVSLETFIKAGKWDIAATANYAYTAVVLREDYRPNSFAVGRQVPYQPFHVGNVSLKLSYSHAFLQTTVRYTGSRHTTDYYDNLPAYWLANVNAGYAFSLKNCTITLIAQINNMFDVEYQNMKYFAMPGRTFNGTLHVEF